MRLLWLVSTAADRINHEHGGRACVVSSSRTARPESSARSNSKKITVALRRIVSRNISYPLYDVYPGEIRTRPDYRHHDNRRQTWITGGNFVLNARRWSFMKLVIRLVFREIFVEYFIFTNGKITHRPDFEDQRYASAKTFQPTCVQ